ncbi:hypothetical protein QE152_g29031 [Popillia japonica]|uniref:Uncharacterized protein n=1 Tax=Popillia japonica TaxID=7064 RepID=A0AAW1JJH2_POPJA
MTATEEDVRKYENLQDLNMTRTQTNTKIRVRDYGLEINMKKCRFLQKRVEFLGHVIENGRIEPSDAKTKAVLRFPELKTIKQVQSFLGLTGYFRHLTPKLKPFCVFQN